jgi:hypothetical protein
LRVAAALVSAPLRNDCADADDIVKITKADSRSAGCGWGRTKAVWK